MMFDRDLLEKIRAEFPRAVADLNGRKRAFFDNGTGTLVVGRAARAEAEARVNCSANVDAGFAESKKAEAVILEGRKAVAGLLNAPSPDTIISGESATALLFNLSYAIGKELTGKENVVTTDYDHYANISPWMELENRRKIQKVRFARLNKDEGTLDMEHLQSLIDTKTKVVTVTAASNVLGTKSPLEEIGKMAKEVNAYFVVDAVHHVAHGSMDIKALDCDFLVFSGYKLFSSHGSFLYGKKDHLNTLKPYKVASVPNHAPKKWEWGTRDQSMFAAIRGVADYFVWLADQVQNRYEGSFTEYSGRKRSLKVAMDAIEKYEAKLAKAVLAGFDDIKGLRDMSKVRVYGLTDLNRLKERDPTFAFKVENMPDDEVVDRLWTEGGIATRSEDFYSRALESYNQKTMIARADLLKPESIKDILATHDDWSSSYKNQIVSIYKSFADFLGLRFQPPRCKLTEKVPFIPTEKEIDQLIAGCGKKTAAFLQLLKETGMRAGEAGELKWKDIDLERKTVRATAKKYGKPRELRISDRLIGMLNRLPHDSVKVWSALDATRRGTFIKTRKRVALKLNNPRINQIHFHTFRHWKATMEYHKTHSILHVMALLGHRNIQSTMIYTHLIAFESNRYISRVTKNTKGARVLVEAGFEYVCTTPEDLMLFRKPK